MAFISVVCVVCAAAASASRDPQPPGRTDKNADLLEVIKLSLRKNNDDYSDTSIMKNNTENATLLSSRARPLAAREHIHIGDVNVKGARRANDIIIDSDMIDNMLDFGSTPAKNNSSLGSRKNGIVNRLKGNQMIRPIDRYPINRVPPSVTTSTPPTLTTPKKTFTKSLDRKIEKVRKFYEKNKHLLKQFLSSKIAARTLTTAPRTEVTRKVNLRERAKVKKVKGVLSRGQNWLGEEDNTTEPPNPDLLDMMPAIGGRIHFRRIEGRLCHRHVVVPEGPKYDSKGRIYLAAHAAKVRRPYNVTRRPSLLLPKCCNCCKKSVLGCE